VTEQFQPFLSVSLTVSYRGKPPVLRDLFLQMRRGEVLGLAGGSGSGKSTLALALMRLLDSRACDISGHICFEGHDLLALNEGQMRHLRGRQIALVLQSPAAALNPVLRIGTQMREAWRAHGDNGLAGSTIRKALDDVSLPSSDEFLRRYPSQISTGQGQRVLIAMALLHQPSLLIADEPTSALDAITQSDILELLRERNRATGTGVLLISHDLNALATVCDRIAILSDGKIIECDTVHQVFANPVHGYTRRLTASSPVRHLSVER
jgi:ABC-type dipeptide/oligopeptide/nickel transport system ATPase component